MRILQLDIGGQRIEFHPYVSVVRDLHTVFPAVKIVALAAGPKTMSAALKAGATVVLPRSTPPAMLAKIIQRLEKRR